MTTPPLAKEPPRPPAKLQPALERGKPALERGRPALERGDGGNLTLVSSTPSEPDEDAHEAWIADLSDVGRQIPRPLT
jgi:hypothetical protein